MLFAELVFGAIRVGIAAQPEVLDEAIALFVVRKAFERLYLIVADDPLDVLLEPLLVGAFELILEGFPALDQFAVGTGTGGGVGLVVHRRVALDFGGRGGDVVRLGILSERQAAGCKACAERGKAEKTREAKAAGALSRDLHGCGDLGLCRILVRAMRGDNQDCRPNGFKIQCGDWYHWAYRNSKAAGL